MYNGTLVFVIIFFCVLSVILDCCFSTPWCQLVYIALKLNVVFIAQVLDIGNDVLLLMSLRGNFILFGSKPQSPPHRPLASQLKLLADRQTDGGFTTFPVSF